MSDSPSTPPPCIALLSLGCAKNLVDSELIASVLEANGAVVVHDPAEADVAIVNTCGFIGPAKEEAVDTILEVASLKGGGRLQSVIVTGCLGERYREDLSGLLPEADVILGIGPQQAAQAALVAAGLGGRQLCDPASPRLHRLTPQAWSYLRISHGCDNRCAYCAIPIIRGPLRSRPYDELLGEAAQLAAAGVRELNVIAQDTANYGVDTESRQRVHELLADLCAVDELRWVRLLYVHPAHLYDELIDVVGGEEKVCPYVDVPLQHINDGVLARMGRKVTRAQVESLIGRLRERIPGVTLRTTFITGFPGETEGQFEELLDFVEAMEFERLGCFPYSREEGTPAAGLPDQVPEEVAQERSDAVMAVQQEIAFRHAVSRKGERAVVLVEDGEADGDEFVAARSCHEAPDVDPVILLPPGPGVVPGRFVGVEIIGSAGYDCVAEVREGSDEEW